MSKRYFDLFDDVYIPGRWELGHPLDQAGRKLDDLWQFGEGAPAHPKGAIKIPVEIPGQPLDFSHAAVDTPVVNARVASIFSALAPDDVQLIPVQVNGQAEQHFILNATRLIRCIDDAACEEVEYWTPEDGVPEKVGKYFSIFGLRIDPTKVGGAQVFRPWGWTVVLIVSAEIKEALERAGVTGVKFKEVTGPGPAPSKAAPPPSHRALLEQVDAAREAAFRALGDLEQEAIIPIAVGGPPWPAARQSFRVTRRAGGRMLLATEGLADPFLDREEPSTGFGLELIIETDEPCEPPVGSWPLELLERVAAEVAGHSHVRERIMRGFLSMEVSGEGMPESLVTPEGRVGVLLDQEASPLPRSFTSPAGEVQLVPIATLLPAELAYLRAHGAAGRRELVRRLAQRGDAHLSRAQRQPVV